MIASSAPRILRPRVHAVGGVCAGLAAHLGCPPSLVRGILCVLVPCGGAGLLLYAWLWATTPLAPSGAGQAAVPDRPARSAAVPGAVRRAPVAEILLGLALLVAGGAMIASRLGAPVPLASVIPAVVVLVGVGLAWRQVGEMRGGEIAGRSSRPARAMGALALVVLGVLMFFLSEQDPNVWTVLVAAAAVLLGIGVAVAPGALRLARDLAEERAAHARELERAEVAAHLHDSVLQTLALIQQKAGPGSEASRLARAQEQELRAWLFTESAPGRGDLASELIAAARRCEEDHAVRIDVVTTGVPVPVAPEPLVAAAREAMLNAARHAGGTVSVYAEASAERIEITVSDRGPGFDLDQVPAERYGVRASIIGRMHRSGGSARLGRGPGGTGTRVVLTLPRVPASTTVSEEER
ncbi:ATP-binding protein [Brachybacterium hainanense]|uniref:PspC domain-containing protein n=1 Tax=Brachybacterium hainanense TaxID=1541174 RepID=A0ABV6R8P8_9MICO